jgi:hypothetical protein
MGEPLQTELSIFGLVANSPIFVNPEIGLFRRFSARLQPPICPAAILRDYGGNRTLNLEQRSFAEELPGPELRLLADFCGEFAVVGRNNQCRAILCIKPKQKILDFLANTEIEGARGFIREDQFGLQND